MKKFIIAAVVAATATFSGAAAFANSGWIAQGITLNARSGPGTHYGVIAKFSPCTQVHVAGWKHGWAKVTYNHKHYWVSGKYLTNHACKVHKPHNTYNNNNHNTYNNNNHSGSGTYKKY